ncbi:hypothetical protein V500_08318 [Pseudogymnoascus sp. VKM F-4518 (FW-2643)]|nr:hypothetical protein V500_08318 [Pseudogymnoascus sp. VKM F-4518 (FW-2643)]
MTGDRRCDICGGCLPPKSKVEVVDVKTSPPRTSNGTVIPATTEKGQYTLELWKKKEEKLERHCNVLHFEGHGVEFIGVISDNGQVVVSARGTGGQVVTKELLS